jgi:heme-degrading monooxygenase HmoA
MYAIVWTYTTRPGEADAFAEAYGPAGPWAELFNTAEGYIGAELMRCDERPDEFITIDRWESREAFVAFMGESAGAYQDLDERFSNLTLIETRLGGFSQ